VKNGDSTLLDRKQDVSRAMLPHGTNSSDDFQSPPEALDPLSCRGKRRSGSAPVERGTWFER
jgi:hypothetical protein